jgi:hypothetical protein
MDHDDELPIVVLRPKRVRTERHPTALAGYIGMLVEIGGSSRDDYVIDAVPRIWAVDIDCGNMNWNDFGWISSGRNS